jgi:transcriptional regulator with XRE-family HTH domain
LDESPLVARRRVRLALRDARERKGLTQGQVADAMEWSLSKVMRIESGDVTVAPNDLRPLLTYLGVPDQGEVDSLLRDSRLSRRRRQKWWDEPPVRDHLTPAMRRLFEFELDATAVRHFNSMIVPGRLQTPAYAEAILEKYRRELPDADIRIRLEARQRRRTELLARKDCPRIFVLLDESVLHREVGGAQVLSDQLSDLLVLVERTKVVTRVVPYSADAPLPMFGAYDLLYLGATYDDENALMYRETHLSDQIVEDKAVIADHREVFEQLWEAALDEATSVGLIERRAKSLLTPRSYQGPG